MSLSSAFRVAQGALLNTARQTGVAARNVSDAANPGYHRREALLTTSQGGATILSIRRSADGELLRHSLAATASASGQSYLASAATRLQQLINGDDNATAPATLLARFEDSLQQMAAEPDNALIGEVAVNAAQELASGVATAADAVQRQRGSIDADIAGAVADINGLLARFEAANNEIIKGTLSNRDVSDAADTRDAILKDLSNYLGISTVTRPDNGMMIFSSQGATLFETVPRHVTFEPTDLHQPGIAGNPVRIDGVPLRPGTGSNTDADGSLAAMLQVRDGIAMRATDQLDEMARGLILAFAELDQSGTGAPALSGLFTGDGSPALPSASVRVPGLAQSLGVHAAYNSTLGGSPALLRDGGANGAGYIVTDGAGPGNPARLNHYLDAINQPFAADPLAGLSAGQSLSDYAQSSIGWIEGVRSTAIRTADTKTALGQRLETALSNAVGVNLDEELSALVEFEQSYQASSRILNAVDTMMDALFAVAR
jgi:flagellar hook-associated protein 1 FlgK